MKKIFIASALFAALTLASCGNSNKTAAPAADSTATDSIEQVDTTALAPEAKTALSTLTATATEAIKNKDPKVLTTTLANLQATYAALVNAGKLDDAKTYGSAIKNFIVQNADAIKSVASGNATIASLIDGIKNLPTTAETTADQAKAAVASDVVSLASPYLQKAAATTATAEAAAAALKNAPTTVQEAAAAIAGNAKTAAETAAQNAVTSAENAAVSKANEAVTNAQNKANEAVQKEQQKAAKKVNEAQKKANDAVNKAAGKALKGLGL